MEKPDDIPQDIRAAAWNAAGHIYAPDNKCHAYATDIIAKAIYAERLAAEKRGREEAAKICETHRVYEIGDRHMLAAAIRSGQ